MGGVENCLMARTCTTTPSTLQMIRWNLPISSLFLVNVYDYNIAGAAENDGSAVAAGVNAGGGVA